ncbi:hypothetical protein [Methylobacterium sp. NEAU K]|uniref:hypothetical protein n=1 Tax=Methylobacterium sp. NEAU K TaxID=3064946 RepID=UPI0027338269|nr:hypothetical protein [Methylobacterium sp. NEAU K]MDP4005223.1 hypothetical protein [Methylobacterium sp. NEAU K]
MAVLRYILLGVSTLAMASVLIFWIAGGRSGDVSVFFVIAFLAANIAYILFSSPNLKISALFDRAATGLAFASLELQHQAKEAKLREIEADRLRAEDAEQNRYKLRAAEEFISYVRQNPLMKRRNALEVNQIALRSEPHNLALPALEMARSGQPELHGRLRADPGAAGMARPGSHSGAMPRLEG